MPIELTERDKEVASLYVDYILAISKADRCIERLEELNATLPCSERRGDTQ